MKQKPKLLHTLALVAMISALLPGPSHGRSIGSGAAGRTQYENAAAPPKQESWVGAGAAIGCGFGIRVSRATRNPWAVLGTVLLCMIALADGLGDHS
jgi:hypothetical protein